MHKRRKIIWITLGVFLTAFITGWLVRLWRLRQRQAPGQRYERLAPPRLAPDRIKGLTEAEAAERKSEGQDNAINFVPRRTKEEIWRDSILTIFNLNLVGLAGVQLLLGRPLDALMSTGVLCLNIGVNVAQQLFAMNRLGKVEQGMRQTATVVRDGLVKSIDPGEIVLGDALIAGPGDQFLADGEIVGDGQIVVDESMLGRDNGRVIKRPGDPVYAGSFCTSGHTAYLTQKVGDDRLLVSISEKTEAGNHELTPLQAIIARVLKVMLALVVVFSGILLFSYVRTDITDIEQYFINAASLIFTLAPSGLFFMILVGYAMGTADLVKIGALVHRSESVETLANVNVVCLSSTGSVTGIKVEMDVVEQPNPENSLAESRIRQILGEYTRSISDTSQINKALADSFPGERRRAIEEAPFLSAYGWSAVSFDDNDLRGVYVLGDPPILGEDYTGTLDASEEPDNGDEQPSALNKLFKRMSGLIKLGEGSGDSDLNERPGLRGSEASVQGDQDPSGEGPLEDKAKHNLEPFGPGSPDSSPVDGTVPVEDFSDSKSNEAPRQGSLFGRIKERVSGILRRPAQEPPDAQVKGVEARDQTTLVFAFHPALVPLHDESGRPSLPDGLIPLCHLRYFEQIRPDAKETIQSLVSSKVEIKMLSAERPEKVADLVLLAGLGSENGPPGIISGKELSEFDSAQFSRAVEANTIFGQLTSEQKREIVQTLRNQGRQVAMVGDGVDDVSALRQADLGITSRGGSQAALSVADIVLLKDSLKVLLDVLAKGQRIVKGLLDVLKLYLTQVFYLALLLLMVRLTAFGLPYHPSQGSVIALITLTIPAFFLSLWAPTGAISSTRMSRQLARFVIPAGLTTGLAGLMIFLTFLLNKVDLRYAQLAVTYFLAAAGLLLVIFVRTPTSLWVGGNELSGDRRFIWIAIGLFIIFLVMLSIPLAQEVFKIGWLPEPLDYLVIGFVVILWAFGVRATWLIHQAFTVRRYKPERSVLEAERG